MALCLVCLVDRNLVMLWLSVCTVVEGRIVLSIKPPGFFDKFGSTPTTDFHVALGILDGTSSSTKADWEETAPQRFDRGGNVVVNRAPQAAPTMELSGDDDQDDDNEDVSEGSYGSAKEDQEDNDGDESDEDGDRSSRQGKAPKNPFALLGEI